VFVAYDPSMGKAQDRLGDLIKSVWGPALREMGFTGSGKVWTLPDERDWAMLGFQTSQASTGDTATTRPSPARTRSPFIGMCSALAS
jgi:hypothetical protein